MIPLPEDMETFKTRSYNFSYIITIPGALKCCHVIGCLICCLLVAHYKKNASNRFEYGSAEIFVFLVSAAFFVSSTCLLASYLLSVQTMYYIPRTLYEIIYHLAGCAFYIVASIWIISDVSFHSEKYNSCYFHCIAVSIVATIMALLFLQKTVLAHLTYKSMMQRDLNSENTQMISVYI